MLAGIHGMVVQNTLKDVDFVMFTDKMRHEFFKWAKPEGNMKINNKIRQINQYRYCDLKDIPEYKNRVAKWFHNKWRIPTEAYLECIDNYIEGKTKNGWYICLNGNRIIAGLGVIDNDFHNRTDLTPNVCAVYTEVKYRCQGIAGKLLNYAVEDMRSKGISPLYLVTDHTSFYERYGWEFLCMVQSDGEPEMSRMYIHK